MRVHLTSIHSNPRRGPYGSNRYRGNCGGYLIRDLLQYDQPQHVLDPMMAAEPAKTFAESSNRLHQHGHPDHRVANLEQFDGRRGQHRRSGCFFKFNGDACISYRPIRAMSSARRRFLEEPSLHPSACQSASKDCLVRASEISWHRITTRFMLIEDQTARGTTDFSGKSFIHHEHLHPIG